MIQVSQINFWFAYFQYVPKTSSTSHCFISKCLNIHYSFNFSIISITLQFAGSWRWQVEIIPFVLKWLLAAAVPGWRGNNNNSFDKSELTQVRRLQRCSRITAILHLFIKCEPRYPCSVGVLGPGPSQIFKTRQHTLDSLKFCPFFVLAELLVDRCWWNYSNLSIVIGPDPLLSTVQCMVMVRLGTVDIFAISWYLICQPVTAKYNKYYIVHRKMMDMVTECGSSSHISCCCSHQLYANADFYL